MLGVEAQAVRDVVITHLHYDHVGNFELFPAATFHLQDEELAYATGRHMARPVFSGAFDVEDVVGMVRNVYRGRVRFHDGDAELFPGVSVHLIGGHTKGLQVVRIATRRGWLVLASDASHFYANMEQARPFPIVYSVADMVEGYDRLRQLAQSPAHIIPGHDPEVLRRYPAPRADGAECAACVSRCRRVFTPFEPSLALAVSPRRHKRSATTSAERPVAAPSDPRAQFFPRESPARWAAALATPRRALGRSS